MAEPHAQTAARLAAWLARAGAAPLRPHQLHQLCRGKYGNVWESVMRQVLPRQMARRRRLQVLVQDVRRYRTVENTVRERMGVVVLPEELEVWRETQALREEVARAEARVASGKKLVGELADRVARKLGQRAALTESVEDARRRLCLLAATAERLQAEAGQLAEMTDCTRQLLPADTSDNAEEAIDKCLSILGELAGRQTTDKNAQADCTQLGDVSGRADREQVMSAHEKLLSLLARVSATELWAALQERQGRLVREMAEGASVTAPATERRNGAQSCIAETSALHCTLTLRALENGRSAPAQQRRLLQLIHQAQVAGAAPDAEARGELFILHCEKADLESRVRALRSELEDLLARRGPYKVGSTCDANSGSFDSVDHILAEIEAVDRECLVKKAGTEARMCSLERTSVKIASVCGQLRALFGVSEKPWGPGEPLSLTGGGKHDASVNSVNSNYDEFVNYFRDGRTGAAPERPAERPARARLDLSIFMRGRGGTQPPRLDLSLDLDRSGRSENTLGESSEPRFTDELRLFLSKFRLEKNRKIVLDSGESLWIFQTLDGLARSAQLSRAPLALAQTLAHAGALGAARAHALDRARLFAERSQRDSEVLGWTACADIDIAGLLEAGTERIDRLKKRLSEARASLERTGARLGRGLEDTAWWRAARPARCVAAARRLDGRSWREFEAAYADLCSDPLG